MKIFWSLSFVLLMGCQADRSACYHPRANSYSYDDYETSINVGQDHLQPARRSRNDGTDLKLTGHHCPDCQYTWGSQEIVPSLKAVYGKGRSLEEDDSSLPHRIEDHSHDKKSEGSR